MVKVLVLIKGWYDSSRECFNRKIYKLEQQEQQEHYKTLLELGEDHVVQAVIESVNIINESGLITDDKNLVVALTDHIIYAYKRLKQHQMITNPFVIETKHLYSNAYNVARKVIDKLNKTLDVHFPEDEIGFIALHIASNSEKLSIHDISVINKLINKVLQLLKLIYNIQLINKQYNIAFYKTHTIFNISIN